MTPIPGTQDPYLEFLRTRVDRVFYRMPYPGNAGDSLIQFATDQILHELKIQTTVDPRQADVILVPGGNPTMWPGIGAERWQLLWTRHAQAEFVVGPAGFRSGYTDWQRALNQAGTRVSGLFARDPDSFRTLSNAGLRAEIVVGLSHDPALYLRDSGWLAEHRRAASDEYDLAAFRDDHETNLGFPGGSLRLRSILPWRAYNWMVRRGAGAVRSRKFRLAKAQQRGGIPLLENDVSSQRFGVFVETIRAARIVHTDRLHVMLLAAILGKKVLAYPTANGKLEGVYQHSLAGWADVKFITM
jgi:exopolysaccharide biosynthesis predicted pyruvyltransferase EpsI